MKNIKDIVIYFAIVALFCIFASLKEKESINVDGIKNKHTNTIVYDTVYIHKKIDKDKLVEAFIFVESTGDDKAVNKRTKATGCLQLMPIMIEDANRISGRNYTLNDRYNRKKSIEIFHIIMEHYNPNYDLHLACKIWNPKSSVGYHRRIEKKYNELLNE